MKSNKFLLEGLNQNGYIGNLTTLFRRITDKPNSAMFIEIDTINHRSHFTANELSYFNTLSVESYTTKDVMGHSHTQSFMTFTNHGDNGIEEFERCISGIINIRFRYNRVHNDIEFTYLDPETLDTLNEVKIYCFHLGEVKVITISL